MNMPGRRSKLVTFRVSLDEYRKLCQACADRGLRSVSELTRTCLQGVLSDNCPDGKVDDQIHDLWTRFQLLSAEFERLSQQVEVSNSPATLSGSKLNA